MKSFSLILEDVANIQSIEGVTSFVGEDSSGSFGILPDHGRFMTSLVMGLCRFRRGDEPWQYIATPGALLYFKHNQLQLISRHFLIDTDYMALSDALQQQLLQEESQLHEQKQSLRRMEEEVLKRLWEAGRRQA